MSIRIRKGTTKRLKKLGINSSERAREYLEDLAWKAEAKRTINGLEELIKRTSKPSKAGFALKSIREDRDATH